MVTALGVTSKVDVAKSLATPLSVKVTPLKLARSLRCLYQTGGQLPITAMCNAEQSTRVGFGIFNPAANGSLTNLAQAPYRLQYHLGSLSRTSIVGAR